MFDALINFYWTYLGLDNSLILSLERDLDFDLLKEDRSKKVLFCCDFLLRQGWIIPDGLAICLRSGELLIGAELGLHLREVKWCDFWALT